MSLDSASFEAIYAANADRLYGTAYRLLRDRDAAADVVQDAFLKAYTAADEIREPAAWLTTVTRNGALNVLRRSGRLTPLAEEATDDDELTAPELVAAERTADPVRAAATAEALTDVDKLLGTLTPAQRTALVLFHVQEQPISSIAELLGRTVNATTVLLHRSRAALRARYADRVYARQGIPGACVALRPELLAHVEGKATSQDFLAHLADDPVCQAIEQELRTMGQVLAVLPAIPAPASIHAALSHSLATTATTSAGSVPATVATAATSNAPTIAVVGAVGLLGAAVLGALLLAQAPTPAAAQFPPAELGQWAAVDDLQAKQGADGSLYVAWETYDHGARYELFVASRAPDGTWGAATSLARKTFATAPTLGMDADGSPCVVYDVSWEPDVGDAPVSMRCLGEDGWSAPIGVPADSEGVVALSSCSTISATGHPIANYVSTPEACWLQADEAGLLHLLVTDWELLTHRYSSDGGASWSEARTVGQIDRHSTAATVLADPRGGLQLFWAGLDHLQRARWTSGDGWRDAALPDLGPAPFAVALLEDGRVVLVVVQGETIDQFTEQRDGSWAGPSGVATIGGHDQATLALTAGANNLLTLAWAADGRVMAGQTLSADPGE